MKALVALFLMMATCTTHTYVLNGRTVVCTTCCDSATWQLSGTCRTTCN